MVVCNGIVEWALLVAMIMNPGQAKNVPQVSFAHEVAASRCADSSTVKDLVETGSTIGSEGSGKPGPIEAEINGVLARAEGRSSCFQGHAEECGELARQLAILYRKSTKKESAADGGERARCAKRLKDTALRSANGIARYIAVRAMTMCMTLEERDVDSILSDSDVQVRNAMVDALVEKGDQVAQRQLVRHIWDENKSLRAAITRYLLEFARSDVGEEIERMRRLAVGEEVGALDKIDEQSRRSGRYLAMAECLREEGLKRRSRDCCLGELLTLVDNISPEWESVFTAIGNERSSQSRSLYGRLAAAVGLARLGRTQEYERIVNDVSWSAYKARLTDVEEMAKAINLELNHLMDREVKVKAYFGSALSRCEGTCECRSGDVLKEH